MTQLEMILPPRPNPPPEVARAERDQGIAAAAEHQERESVGWTELAAAFIHRYARTHREFISEECTEASREYGLIQPENQKAWGQPFRLAAKRGYIKKHPDKLGVSKRRHLSPCPLWVSRVYRGDE